MSKGSPSSVAPVNMTKRFCNHEIRKEENRKPHRKIGGGAARSLEPGRPEGGIWNLEFPIPIDFTATIIPISQPPPGPEHLYFQSH